jgi:hypothetical protein
MHAPPHPTSAATTHHPPYHSPTDSPPPHPTAPQLDPKHWAAIHAGPATSTMDKATPFANAGPSAAAIERAAILAADAVGSAALPMPSCTLPDTCLPISPLDTSGTFDLASSRRLLAAMGGGQGQEVRRLVGGSSGGGGGGSKRKNRGNRLSELIKSEEQAGSGAEEVGGGPAVRECRTLLLPACRVEHACMHDPEQYRHGLVTCRWPAVT